MRGAHDASPSRNTGDPSPKPEARRDYEISPRPPLDQAKRELARKGFVPREKAREARRHLARLELTAPTEFLSDAS